MISNGAPRPIQTMTYKATSQPGVHVQVCIITPEYLEIWLILLQMETFTHNEEVFTKTKSDSYAETDIEAKGGSI